MAIGDAVSNGQISAQGNGSFVGGYAQGAGILTTELNGSFAMGVVDTNGQVSANGTATMAMGYADGSSILGAVGNGSQAFGYATTLDISSATTKEPSTVNLLAVIARARETSSRCANGVPLLRICKLIGFNCCKR